MQAMRLHLFERNDTPWAPAALRETIVESLSRTLDWGRVIRGLAPAFAQFLDRTDATEVLDLCSGAGSPAAILADELRRMGRKPPTFVLTDLQPRVESWRRLKARHGDCIDWIAEPIDASRIPKYVLDGRVRVVINALHHFRPELAGAILRDASNGIFVAEGFERSPSGFAPFAFAGIPSLYVNPLVAPDRNVAKALYTWASPIALAASIWDGLVSTMRVYTESKLRRMVDPTGLAWCYGTYDFFSRGRGYYFFTSDSERAVRVRLELIRTARTGRILRARTVDLGNALIEAGIASCPSRCPLPCQSP